MSIEAGKNDSRVEHFHQEKHWVMPVTFLNFQSLNQPPRRAMNAAITRVHVQICDVNHKQPIDLFCKKMRSVIFFFFYTKEVSGLFGINVTD